MNEPIRYPIEWTALFDCGCRWRGAELMPCARHSEDELRHRVNELKSLDGSVSILKRRLS